MSETTLNTILCKTNIVHIILYQGDITQVLCEHKRGSICGYSNGKCHINKIEYSLLNGKEEEKEEA